MVGTGGDVGVQLGEPGDEAAVPEDAVPTSGALGVRAVGEGGVVVAIDAQVAILVGLAEVLE